MVRKNQEAIELTPKSGYSSLYLLLLLVLACDTTIEPTNALSIFPEVVSVSIPADSISFTRTDGFVDTTITLPIDATIMNIDEGSSFGFVIRDAGTLEALILGDLSAASQENQFSGQASINTSTTSVENYLIEVYAFDPSGRGGFAQTPLYIVGFSSAPPSLTRTTSPGTIIRPASGSIPAVFTAQVTDPDGDDTIARVSIRVIQNNVDVQGSPFEMFDDGSTLGDTTANDFVFTWSQDVTPTTGEQDRDFDIEFFAVDQGGLYSDTVRTTFSIRGN